MTKINLLETLRRRRVSVERFLAHAKIDSRAKYAEWLITAGASYIIPEDFTQEALSLLPEIPLRPESPRALARAEIMDDNVAVALKAATEVPTDKIVDVMPVSEEPEEPAKKSKKTKEKKQVHTDETGE